MNEILEIGQILETNDAGFIVNHSRVEKIVEPWKPVVEAVSDGYLKHLSDNVHSIYIRGSVARGLAREGISDVDSFAVVREPVSDLAWAASLSREIGRRFPFCVGVEVVCLTHDELLQGDDEYHASWRMMLKTQCVCVFGEDLAGRLPDYKPGAETVVHATDLRRQVQRLTDDLRALLLFGRLPFGNRLFKSSDGGYGPLVSLGCAELMKRIVRTGFEIVMEKEGVYTRDLYPCYKIFSKHFPARERSMRRALELAINPTSDPKELLEFLEDFGPWMINAAEARYAATAGRAGLRARLTSTWRDLVRIYELKR
ncbi:MAG TPA: nucleotidyltransferase domain-containing protein [Pyrinomonadaceae bacterium]